MRRKKTLIIIILIVLAGLIWWYLSRRQDAATSAEDSSLIYDRVWVDQKPKMSKAYIHALFVAEHVPVGIFQKASAYRLELERFVIGLDGIVHPALHQVGTAQIGEGLDKAKIEMGGPLE